MRVADEEDYVIVTEWVSDLLLAFFFFNATAPTEIYPLSLPAALPISPPPRRRDRPAPRGRRHSAGTQAPARHSATPSVSRPLLPPGSIRGMGRRRIAVPTGSGHRQDRKSTRLNSSHGYISYAVFCLKE